MYCERPLNYRPPLAAAALLGFLESRAIPGVEEVIGGCYRRTITMDGVVGVVELEPMAGASHVLLRLFGWRDPDPIARRCRYLFDLDADPDAIASALSTDTLLRPLLAARPGLRVPGTVDGFEMAVRAILGQQVSVAGARTLTGRLAAALGEPLAEPNGSLSHAFPTPAAVAGADLGGLGITGARIAALRAIARALDKGALALEPGADRQETEAALLALPGIGPWTASYIALRALGDRDALPAGDLGLRRAFEQHGLAGDPAAITRHAEAWRPYRGYAALHLWTSRTAPRPLGAISARPRR